MGRAISRREWRATQLANAVRIPGRLASARFALTPAGEAVLRAAEAARAADAERGDGRPACAWCQIPLKDGDALTMRGGEILHSSPCVLERDAWDSMATDDDAEDRS